MISESLGLFMISNPSVTSDSCSLMIYEFLDAVWVSSSTRTCDCSFLMICESLSAFELSNPTITRHSSSLMISESLGAVWAVESICHM